MRLVCTTTSIRDGLFWSETELAPGSEHTTELVRIHPSFRYQTFEGFGGAFTEAAGYCFSKLGAEAQREVLEGYFGTTGLRYVLGRTPMNSCDFALGNYACVEDPTDTALESFSIERDRRYILPLLKAAQAHSADPIRLMLSPWSPPAFMKTNGSMNGGGSLKPEFAPMWADCIVRYIQAYRAEALHVAMVSVQNEPAAAQSWDSCLYTAEEEGAFAALLGTKLHAAGLDDIQLLVWDHNKELLFPRMDTILQNADAARYVSGAGFHWYTGDHFEALALVRERYPGMKLYFTEGCVEYSRFADRDGLQKAEMIAHDILGNLAAGMHGSIDWNLLLDAQGGPNHVGNYCEAAIMCTEDAAGVEKRPAFHYIGHFSRFIRPGAVRLALTRYTDAIEAVCLENPDGERVTVLLNRADKDLTVSLSDGEKTVFLVVKAHTIATVRQLP